MSNAAGQDNKNERGQGRMIREENQLGIFGDCVTIETFCVQLTVRER